MAVQNPLLPRNVTPDTVHCIDIFAVTVATMQCVMGHCTQQCVRITHWLSEADQLHLFRDYYRAHYIMQEKCAYASSRIVRYLNVLYYDVFALKRVMDQLQQHRCRLAIRAGPLTRAIGQIEL